MQRNGKRLRSREEVIDVDTVGSSSAVVQAIDVDAVDVDSLDEITPAPRKSQQTSKRAEALDVDSLDEITPAPPKPSSSSQGSSAYFSSQSTQDLEADELLDPSVSVVDLFRQYNQLHFWGSLRGVFVEFSNRMTSCAGTCTFRGKLGGCRIALSEPLLKYRPRSDLLSTLLHEMIHAYLFLTEGIAARDGHDGHGPKFLSHAARINTAERGRVRITPYHTFHDEVELYRVHHWTCARCGRVIKRAMNRAPAPRDPWWPRHQAACGGAFVKTKEPEKKKKWKRPRKGFKGVAAIDPNDKDAPKPPPGVMRTQRVEDLLTNRARMVNCPVCDARVPERAVNEHLDGCVGPNMFADDPAPVPPPARAAAPAASAATPAAAPVGQTTPARGRPVAETVTPLSGQLFKDRHFGAGSTGRYGAGASPGARSTPGGNVTGSTAHRATIDESAVSSALQVLFGGTDALMAYAIGGKPIPPYTPVGAEKAEKPRFLLSFATEAVEGGPETPIKPVGTEWTATEVLEIVKERLVADGRRNVRPGSASSTGTYSRVIDGGYAVEAVAKDLSSSFSDLAQVHGESSGAYRQPVNTSAVVRGSNTLSETGTFADGASRPPVPTVPRPSRKKPRTNGENPASNAIRESPTIQKVNRPSEVMGTAQTRPLSDSFQRGSSGSSVTRTNILGQNTKMRPDLAGPSVWKPIDSSGSSSTRNPLPARNIPQAVTVPCPLCEKLMPRTELDGHVSICLTETGFEPDTDFESPRAAAPPPLSRTVPSPVPANPLPRNQVNETANCPICDQVINRIDLEKHTAICMASTGIMDSFS